MHPIRVNIGGHIDNIGEIRADPKKAQGVDRAMKELAKHVRSRWIEEEDEGMNEVKEDTKAKEDVQMHRWRPLGRGKD